MDEYNTGMDPEIKLLFRKIINSLSYGVLWLIFILATGLFFDLGKIQGAIQWFNIVYYIIAIITLALLVRYYIRAWGGSKTEK